MQKLFLCLSLIGIVLTGCSKNDDEDNGNKGEKLPDLPALPDPDDVCSAMDDITFMAYCYENIDVNKDGKVSVIEANAVTYINLEDEYKQIVSLKGIERFPNLEVLYCKESGIKAVDLRYNLKITNLKFSSSKLESILLPQSQTFTSIESVAFGGCSRLLEIAIPDSVTSIGEKAFSNCSSLTSIDIPENITVIKTLTFASCSKLENIKLPPSLTSIERFAFQNSGLRSINLPSTLISIEEYAFTTSAKLSEVTCYAPIPPKLGYAVFGYQSIETLYVPAESIEAYKKSSWGHEFNNILPIK